MDPRTLPEAVPHLRQAARTLPYAATSLDRAQQELAQRAALH
jgi:hypothetical protein